MGDDFEPQVYDATGAGDQPLDVPGARDDLLAGQHAAVEDRLLRRLASIDTLLARIEAQEEDEELDPDMAARMSALCRAPDAPGDFQVLADRVDSGTTTWKDIWVRPSYHGRAASRLVREATAASMQDSAARLRAGLAAIEEQTPEDLERTVATARRELEDERRRGDDGSTAEPARPDPTRRGPGLS